MLSLLGVLVVILGFALKLDSILIIVVAAIVTAFAGGISMPDLLEMVGSNFVANRNMMIFVVIMLLTGTLERNGLRTCAATLISKVKNATSGLVVGAYGVFRLITSAFNMGFGGVAGFVRPIILPMEIGATEAKGMKAKPEHVEDMKGMAAAMENVCWFFGQVLFVGGSGGLLVQSTLSGLGYEVDLVQLASVQVPVALFAVAFAIIYFFLLDKQAMKKYYAPEKTK